MPCLCPRQRRSSDVTHCTARKTQRDTTGARDSPTRACDPRRRRPCPRTASSSVLRVDRLPSVACGSAQLRQLRAPRDGLGVGTPRTANAGCRVVVLLARTTYHGAGLCACVGRCESIYPWCMLPRALHATPHGPRDRTTVRAYKPGLTTPFIRTQSNGACIVHGRTCEFRHAPLPPLLTEGGRERARLLTHQSP